MIGHFADAFSLIFTFQGLLGIAIGITIGYVVGALPGLSSSMGMALLIPFTFGMDPIAAIAMLVTISMASDYGGAIPAILVNAPGEPSSAISALDGFIMTRRGEAGKALNISIMASTVGALISIVLLVVTAQMMATAALAFGPAEYFAIAILGLSLIAALGAQSAFKSVIGLVLGLAVVTIGIDPISGDTRFVFHLALIDGIPFAPALIGLFALSEVLLMIEEGNKRSDVVTASSALDVSLRPIWPYRRTILRSSLIGYAVGVIPGAGATIASLVSYGVARKLSPTGESFGQGNPEGVAASESANNAARAGALAPLLSLGVPGSASAAVLIGGLTIQGLQPGPLLFTNNPEIPYSIFVALLVGLPVMVAVGFIGVPLWVRMTQVPRPIIAAVVTSIAMLGAYASANNSFEMLIAGIFGVIGYLLRKADIHPAPIVLALVLGEMMEANLRRALITGNESFGYLFTKPITVTLLLVAMIVLLSQLFSRKRVA